MTAASIAASPEPMVDRMVRTRSPPVSPNRPMIRPSTACVDTPDSYSAQQHVLAMLRGDRDTVGKAGNECGVGEVRRG